MPVAVLKATIQSLKVAARVKKMALAQNAVDKTTLFNNQTLLCQGDVFVFRNWHIFSFKRLPLIATSEV
jgi:hypothetical protein